MIVRVKAHGKGRIILNMNIFIDRLETYLNYIKKRKVLGIDRSEVGFIYDMFDPVLFSASRLETIKRMLGGNH